MTTQNAPMGSHFQPQSESISKAEHKIFNLSHRNALVVQDGHVVVKELSYEKKKRTRRSIFCAESPASVPETGKDVHLTI